MHYSKVVGLFIILRFKLCYDKVFLQISSGI